jgi:mono/diheme cytochrome c family protein
MKSHLLVASVLIAAGGILSQARAQAPAQAGSPDARTLYQENCKKCHGVLGTPPKTMKAKYEKIATFDAAFIASRSDDSVVKILTKGKGEDMKSFKEKLTPDEMQAVAKYVRELGSKSHP